MGEFDRCPSKGIFLAWNGQLENLTSMVKYDDANIEIRVLSSHQQMRRQFKHDKLPPPNLLKLLPDRLLQMVISTSDRTDPQLHLEPNVSSKPATSKKSKACIGILK
jgi:hypothetical protein